MEKNESRLEGRLKERVILITGASRGIGRAVSKAYAKEGATVILLARNIAELETLYDEIEQAGNPTAAIYPLNLATATPKDYQDLADNIEKHFGYLSGILHSAALLGTLSPIEHTPIENWYQVLQVNLNAAFLLTQALIPLLKKRKDSRILFTTADVGNRARAYWNAYAVSKAGIQALMQILHEEFETNTSIKVNCINPGKVRTKLRMEAYPAENAKTLPDPKDITSLYVDLITPENTLSGTIQEIQWNPNKYRKIETPITAEN